MFYLFGTFSILGSLLGVGIAFHLKFNQGKQLFSPLATSILIFMLGIMFVMFAMLFDMQVNEDKEVQIRE
jgi:hypothetical protein